MGRFSDVLEREVRLEYMKPEDVSAAKAESPFVFVPFGSIEWHGYHNALGLDAVKAHEQLIGLAVRAGGVVFPPVFFGSGGGHGGWPSTFMFRKEPLVELVTELLQGLDRDGYEKAVLLSGHYPNKSEFLDSAIRHYRQAGGQMDVLALVENQVEGVGGDHAAKFETSFMLYLHPDKVDVQRLRAGPNDDCGGPGERINYMTDEYRGHPCYGLVGIDPRTHANSAVGEQSTTGLIDYLGQWLNGNAKALG